MRLGLLARMQWKMFTFLINYTTMQLTNKKIFWFSFGISLAAFLTLECWVNIIDYHLTDCIIAICTFTMTFICLEYFKADGKTKYWLVCLGVLLGQNIIPLPIHILDFSGSLQSLYFVFTTIINTILAAICYKEKKLTTFILCFIFFLLMTTYVHQTWVEAMNVKMGITD